MHDVKLLKNYGSAKYKQYAKNYLDMKGGATHIDVEQLRQILDEKFFKLYEELAYGFIVVAHNKTYKIIDGDENVIVNHANDPNTDYVIWGSQSSDSLVNFINSSINMYKNGVINENEFNEITNIHTLDDSIKFVIKHKDDYLQQEEIFDLDNAYTLLG